MNVIDKLIEEHPELEQVTPNIWFFKKFAQVSGILEASGFYELSEFQCGIQCCPFTSAFNLSVRNSVYISQIVYKNLTCVS